MPTAWTVPTLANMNNTLAAQLIAAFREKALALGQDDPFTVTRDLVTARIRAEIAHNFDLSMTAGAIPPSTMWVADALIVESMAARLPGLKSMLDGMTEILSDARNYLRRINEGDIEIETPIDPEATDSLQGGPIFTIVTSSTPVATRETLAGL